MHNAVVIGPGRAGSHLAWALRAAGWDVPLVGRRDAVPPAPITFLAVRDAEVDGVAGTVDDGRLLAHLSGLRGPTPAVRLALHPVMTFPVVATAPVSLAGTAFGVTASDEPARAAGLEVVAALGGIPIEIAEADRPLYHAACALASNALVILEEAAAAAMAGAGVADPRAVLGPLVSATVANWRSTGAAALSGPLTRGDRATIERHLAVLDEPALSMYRAAVAAMNGGPAAP